MKQLLIFLFLLLSFPVSMVAGSEGDFFIRIHPDRSSVYEGDSLLLSVVLYATSPIAEASSESDFSVKGKCKLRRLDINRDATAGKVRKGNKIYYTLVWAQYVFAPQQVGTYTVKPQKFKATLQEIVSMPDWIDQMMGARPKYREIKVNGRSEPFEIKVKEKPLRSTQEMMRDAIVI